MGHGLNKIDPPRQEERSNQRLQNSMAVAERQHWGGGLVGFVPYQHRTIALGKRLQCELKTQD